MRRALPPMGVYASRPAPRLREQRRQTLFVFAGPLHSAAIATRPSSLETWTCRACGGPRPAEHQYCFVCGARLGNAVLPANRKGFRFSGISIHAPRLIGRSDRFGERRPPQTLGTWLSRRWTELSLIVVLLWA